jgi:putative acetyltransferase
LDEGVQVGAGGESAEGGGGHDPAHRHRRSGAEVHALAVSGLLDPAVSFFSFGVDGQLLGVGALKRLDAQHAELKSMHIAAAARRRGVGRAMVDHLVRVARDRGFRRLSLETGTMAAFEPARSLYAGAGFVPCEPFGCYVRSPNSTCMTLPLAEDNSGG